MTLVTWLWNMMFSNEETGHPLSLALCKGKREIPPNIPESRQLGFTMRVNVDADHASDTITRHSRTGFLVYLNCALIIPWSHHPLGLSL